MERIISAATFVKFIRLSRLESWTIDLTNTRSICTFLPKVAKLQQTTQQRSIFEIGQVSKVLNGSQVAVTASGPRRLLSTGTRLRKQLDPNVKLCTSSPRDAEEDYVPKAKGDKVLKVRLSTTRLDTILKAGLQISKSKITKAFYDDRIRLNGERPRKKSQQLGEGDEVDLVRGKNKLNPEFLDVARVEIVTLNEDGPGHSEEEEDYSSDDEETTENKIPVVLKRYKSLTIENYPDAWKGGVEES